MSSFGSRLKECRKERNLKLREVSAVVGISIGGLSDLESGRHLGSSCTASLANFYGVEAFWLAEGRGEKSINANGLPGIVNPQPAQAIRNLQEESITSCVIPTI